MPNLCRISRCIWHTGGTLTREALVCLQSNPTNLYEEMKGFILKEGFYYLPEFPRYLQLYNIGMDAYFNLIRGAKASGDYDYIIVDTDNSFNDVKATLFSIADRAVIVSRPGLEGDARLAMLHRILDSDNNTDQVLYARRFCGKTGKWVFGKCLRIGRGSGFPQR